MVCRHENGWIITDEIVLSDNWNNEDIKVKARCNNLGCSETKLFKFDVVNFEEVEE